MTLASPIPVAMVGRAASQMLREVAVAVATTLSATVRPLLVASCVSCFLPLPRPHLRPRPHFKLIVSREEGENNFMRGYRYAFTSMSTISHPGPVALIDGECTDEDIELAAQIVARFSQGKAAEKVIVEVSTPDKQTRSVTVAPLKPEEVPKNWYL